MFTFFRGKMLFLNIIIISIGVFLNLMVINYLINYPLNPVKISGQEGKKGNYGLKGNKGGLGVIGPFGFRGNPGPVGETGKKGFVGVRGQLFKFGATSNKCMNDFQIGAKDECFSALIARSELWYMNHHEIKNAFEFILNSVGFIFIIL